MVKRTGGFRRKTRHKLKKSVDARGKFSIRNYLQTFEVGQRVVLKADSGFQKGMYFPRFHGKSGVVSKFLGSCYEISFKDINKLKTLIVHPVHLKRC